MYNPEWLKAKVAGVESTAEGGGTVPPAIPDHELLRRIGRGSYGEVWLARNIVGTLRAVKVVYRDHFLEARPYEREFQGIRKYEPLSRSNEALVDVLQIGRNDPEGYIYYVMELADPAKPTGDFVPRTLAWDIRARGRLPVEECVMLGLSLNLALGFLHRQGLVHRDVKPSNIIFVSGVPKLADIGLVADLAEAQSFVGTEGFIPPEGPNSAQADIYALGKVLYEAAMGKDRNEFPEPCSALGIAPDSRKLMELNAVLLKACAPNPKERYQSAEEMNADLALLHSGESVREKHVLNRRLRKMKRTLVGVVAAMLLGVLPYTWAIRSALHARRAETGEREELYRAYLAQIHAGRFSQEAGQKRFAGLELASKAAQIRPSLELRNEAIACLALPDMHLVKRREDPASWPSSVGFRKDEVLSAQLTGNGEFRIRNFLDDTEIAFFPGAGEPRLEKLFSPDGRFFCVGHDSLSRQPPRILEVATGKLVFRPDVYGPRAWTISSDSRLIAIAQFEGRQVVICELSTGRQLQSLSVDFLPYDLAFNPTATLLAVSSTRSDSSTNVLVFDLATKQLVEALPTGTFVQGLSFSPDGKMLAACANLKIQFWNVSTATLQAELEGHDGCVVHAAFSPDGKLLASTGWDGCIRLWNVATMKEICLATCEGWGVHFSPDGRWLVNDYGSISSLYEVNRASELRLLGADPMEAAPGAGGDFSPDGQLVAVTDSSGVGIWSVGTGKQLASVVVPGARAAMFHPAGNILITMGEGGIEARRITRIVGSVSLSTAELLAAPAATSRVCLTHEGDQLVVIPNGRVCILDLKSRFERLIAGPAVPNTNIITVGPLQLYDGEAKPGAVIYRTACVDPANSRCAACRYGTNLVQVFDTRTGQLLKSLTTASNEVMELQFSPDGRWLATCGHLGYQFWETTTWHCVHTEQFIMALELHGPLAFSPDSTIAAITLDRRRIRLIQIDSGQELASLEGNNLKGAGMFAWSPDGTHLLASGGNHPAQLWDLGLVRRELAAMNLDWNASRNVVAVGNPK